MAINKSGIFSPSTQQLAAWAKALGHPARISILKTLAEKKACICGEIVEILPLSQSTVSQHLKALKEANLVQGEVEGVRSCYCLNEEEFKLMTKTFSAFFNNITAPWEEECCH